MKQGAFWDRHLSMWGWLSILPHNVWKIFSFNPADIMEKLSLYVNSMILTLALSKGWISKQILSFVIWEKKVRMSDVETCFINIEQEINNLSNLKISISGFMYWYFLRPMCLLLSWWNDVTPPPTHTHKATMHISTLGMPRGMETESFYWGMAWLRQRRKHKGSLWLTWSNVN